MSNQPKSNRKLGLGLASIVVGMFGFGFAMVPLYGLFCDITGINRAGGTGRVAVSDVTMLGVDHDRKVRVDFDSTLNAGLNWEVTPQTTTLEVHPGKVYDVSYRVRNNSDHAVVAQAIPSITPWQATEHFNKTECFCFEQQTLQPGESADLGLRFVLSRTLPEKYNTVTLSYTFMDTNRDKMIRNAVSAR
ncbi:cytochrome c oxidase assembly protein [Solemya velum gill symbiont]|uniref:Cytochrome c oxidase assembly protein CtaG n=1 Tax=Solemya velum gill symbiont TaxID=2340 RepID=A0A0B0H860_SOVGS|nr:cytochrome c oxidase assembly protein [Solemya velum gill symbiont]KHF24064.1 cytochrome oxidase assembly factor [Solemya velum gill symbiont]OOY36174.1 cytochrome c oxidase assembly protein [Solemya velum gill symbiont]OOY38119.1 cytochrome c oxidase assembly protein [Solemya velum gill symbiont]OOY39923.1 cytochrome c oxidase assembly protein [Solemya velum gill symbiont]OOY42074.1 cytochrome c oxidase assembly protein [Solemya velum gill symbiont]